MSISLTPISLPSSIVRLCFAIKEAKGPAYVVGGAVRDHLLHLSPKDIDLEVHGIEPEHLVPILRQHGKATSVGKSFDIWKLSITKYVIDVALPRSGVFSGLTEACRRRDLTLNSIAYDPTEETYHDPFDGIVDLDRKVLRATDPIFFSEDPLRALRVAQFAARFQFALAPSLTELCRQQDLRSIAKERVAVEFEKCWIKSQQPSVGVQYFVQFGFIEQYFEEWPGLNEPLIHDSLDRGKEFFQDSLGWNMALFWAISLSRCTPNQAEKIMDRMHLFTYRHFNIRQAVLSSLSFCTMLAKSNSMLLRRQAAEEFRLDFLCAVSTIIWPNGLAQENIQDAIREGIQKKPLPRIIQGRDLLKLNIEGPDVGICLRFLRAQQLQGLLSSKEEALEAAKKWRPS